MRAYCVYHRCNTPIKRTHVHTHADAERAHIFRKTNVAHILSSRHRPLYTHTHTLSFTLHTAPIHFYIYIHILRFPRVVFKCVSSTGVCTPIWEHFRVQARASCTFYVYISEIVAAAHVARKSHWRVYNDDDKTVVFLIRIDSRRYSNAREIYIYNLF